MGAFLACDWGTTNLRAWLLGDGGEVLREQDFPLGVSRLKPGEAAERFRHEVRPALQAEDVPAILCGMIGSNLGWRAVDYLPCPASLEDLCGALVTVAEGVRIVPGLRGPGVTAAPDVMRGEETQVFGWLRQDPARLTGRHLVCHPGTHAKWVLVEDGRIVRFVTAMTGELFALLRRHSVLKSDAPPDDEAAFDAGVDAAGDGGALAVRLFSARARVTAGGAAPETTPSYLSGLLIGAEIAGAPPLLGAGTDGPIVLLGEKVLCHWYHRALARQGLVAHRYSGDEAALAGLTALHLGTPS